MGHSSLSLIDLEVVISESNDIWHTCWQCCESGSSFIRILLALLDPAQYRKLNTDTDPAV